MINYYSVDVGPDKKGQVLSEEKDEGFSISIYQLSDGNFRIQVMATSRIKKEDVIGMLECVKGGVEEIKQKICDQHQTGEV